MRTLIALVILFLPLICPVRLSALEPVENDCTLGLVYGYSRVKGTFKNEFEDSAFSGFSAGYYIFNWLKLETEYNYNKFEVIDTGGSYLTSYSLSIGPVVSFSISSFLYPYAGVYFYGSHLKLKTGNLGSESTSIKKGYKADAGFIINVFQNIDVRLACGYSGHSLSGESFNTFAVLGGINYRFSSFSHDSKSSELSRHDVHENLISEKYTRAVGCFNSGEAQEAKKIFIEISHEYGNYKKTGNYLSMLEECNKNYNRAKDYLKNKKIYEALPFFEKAGLCIREAKRELVEIRKKLAPEKTNLEKKARDLYFAENYEQCIKVLNKLKLVDPLNRTVSLYLPRARKRYQSYEKFK